MKIKYNWRVSLATIYLKSKTSISFFFYFNSFVLSEFIITIYFFIYFYCLSHLKSDNVFQYEDGHREI
jgi:hypothetical protein